MLLGVHINMGVNMEHRYFINYGCTICLDQPEDRDAMSNIIDIFLSKIEENSYVFFMVKFDGQMVKIKQNWDVNEFLFSSSDNLGDSPVFFLFVCRSGNVLKQEALYSEIASINFYVEDDIKLASARTGCDVMFRDNDSQGLLIVSEK